MNATPQTHAQYRRREQPGASAGEQGLLFDDDRPALDEDVGYRGPTACNAAGITYRQLDYWARTGLVEPTVRGATGSGTQRLYGFRDILVLKVVKRLLDTGISLQQIRDRGPAPARARRRRPRPGHADERRRRVYECTSNRRGHRPASRAARASSASPSAGSGARSRARSPHLPSERTERGARDPQPSDELARATRRATRLTHARPDAGLPGARCGRLGAAADTVRERLRSTQGRSERRRGNSSPEPLRRQDRTGQAPLSPPGVVPGAPEVPVPRGPCA